MFHGKYVIVAEVQFVVETQTIIEDVNVVDVNVTTRSTITKKRCLRIESQEKHRVLLIGKKKNG
jgi:hypothetical protein